MVNLWSASLAPGLWLGCRNRRGDLYNSSIKTQSALLDQWIYMPGCEFEICFIIRVCVIVVVLFSRAFLRQRVVQ